jgi:hypothetical protein
MDRDKMSTLYGGPPVDASYQDLKKSAYRKQELPVVAMFVNGSGLNEQSL